MLHLAFIIILNLNAIVPELLERESYGTHIARNVTGKRLQYHGEWS